MPERPAREPEPTGTTRRSVLHTLGLAAVSGGGAALLGGCSAGGEGSTATSATAGPSPSPGSAPPSASPAARPSRLAQSPGGPAVAARDVPVGSGVVLDQADWIVTQPTAGEFRAFSKFCTHRRCPVASVGGGRIHCLCHRSSFSIDDGTPQGGPATEPLTSAKVAVAGGWVVVTP